MDLYAILRGFYGQTIIRRPPQKRRAAEPPAGFHGVFRCHILRKLYYTVLKQVALALKMWAGDHDDKYPFQVSTNSGGTREFAKSEDTYRHFTVLSNELGNPKVLICRSDFDREPAIDFASLSNRNLSYFLNLAASERGPSMILAGDRNIGLRNEGTKQQIRWGPDLHGYIGNICLNDGSTQVFDPTRSDINLEYYFRDAKLSIPR